MLNGFHLVFALLFTPTLCDKVRFEDYCKFDKDNPPCKTKCRWAYRCGNRKEYIEWTAEEKAYILLLINNERVMAMVSDRAQILKRSNTPKLIPTNMNVLKYNDEAAFLAACHLKRCTLGPDSVRLDHDGNMYGYTYHSFAQEMKMSDGYGRFWKLHLLNKVIKAWSHEKSYKGVTTDDIVDSYTPHSGLENWSQLFWAKTRSIGCGFISSGYTKDVYVYTTLCYYLPTGNIHFQPVFEKGTKLTCRTNSTTFIGLCETGVQTEMFVPPPELSYSTVLRPTNLLFLVVPVLLLTI